jgi:hypothetical protein
VCLGPGVHTVAGTEPLSFGALDSARNGGRVIWRGIGGTSDGAPPTVVTGGVQVTGWAAATLAGEPVLSAKVPAAAASLTAVRQLWVQETRANRTSVLSAEDCTNNCTTPTASKGVMCAPGAAAYVRICPIS